MPSPSHPANAPGDFYVEDGCCIACGVPLNEAPDVFDWAGEPDRSHCVVVRQPLTTAAVNRTLNAMHAAEVDCIRYRGVDAEITRRIVEMGSRDQCDREIGIDAVPTVRCHARVRFTSGSVESAKALAEQFLSDVIDEGSRFKGRVRAGMIKDRRASAHLAWFQDVYHEIVFEKTVEQDWHILTKPAISAAGIGLSRIVERWLAAKPDLYAVEWFSEAQWRASAAGQSTVL